jgi:hypothetical protein
MGRGRFAQWFVVQGERLSNRDGSTAGRERPSRRRVQSRRPDDVPLKPPRFPIIERGSRLPASATPARADGSSHAVRIRRGSFSRDCARSCHLATHAERRGRSRENGVESLVTSGGRAWSERRARTVLAMTMAATPFSANMARELVGAPRRTRGGRFFEQPAPGAGRFSFRRSENGREAVWPVSCV